MRYAALAVVAVAWMAQAAPPGAERWGVYEVVLQGPRGGNPFLDVQVGAQFQFQHRSVDVTGFYDGDGVYRIRFMPDETGGWTYRTGKWPRGQVAK